VSKTKSTRVFHDLKAKTKIYTKNGIEAIFVVELVPAEIHLPIPPHLKTGRGGRDRVSVSWVGGD